MITNLNVMMNQYYTANIENSSALAGANAKNNYMRSNPFDAIRKKKNFLNFSDNLKKVDLNSECSVDNSSFYLIRVSGDSMIGAGIDSGDILLVDGSAPMDDSAIVIAEINGAITVKRLRVMDDGMYLYSENIKYAPIRINPADVFKIRGTVRSVIKTL